LTRYARRKDWGCCATRPVSAYGFAAPDFAGQISPDAQLKILPNPITRLEVPLLACFLLALLWALGIRLAKEWPRFQEQLKASLVQKELESEVDALSNSLADLDELFAAGKLAEKQYWKERLDLKARLRATLKKASPSLLECYVTRHTSSR
jgi:hypothetical protein